MEDQTKILKDSVAVAQESVDTANNNLELIIKERRAHIRVDCDKLDFSCSSLTDGVQYSVVFYGPTNAFIIRSAIMASITESTDTPKETIRFGMTLPEIIPPGTGPIHQNAWFYKKLTEDEVTQIHTGERLVHLNGFIQYKDVFGRERWSYINRVWEYSHISGSLAVSFGYWRKSSPEEDT